MYLTEQDAKTKWCPLTAGRDSSNCIASGCMAWDWIDPEVRWGGTHQAMTPPADEPGWEWHEDKKRWGRTYGERRRGRCGLRSETAE